MKRVLLVAVYFPPSAEAGVYRTYSLFKELFAAGWEPHVLTMNESAYQNLDDSFTPSRHMLTHVHTAFSLNARSHLSIKGKHFEGQVIPDEWWPWILPAVMRGLGLIRKNHFDAILTTYPFASANVVGLVLSKITGVPLVLDFQDPLVFHYNHIHNLKCRINKYIDRKAVTSCSMAIFATRESKDLYAKIYPEQQSTFHVIDNGFDIKSMTKDYIGKRAVGRFTMLYSGSLYIPERDPRPVFRALKTLKDNGSISPENFLLRFRGSGDGQYFRSGIEELDIADLIEWAPRITFLQSLQEILEASLLLLIQGEAFNRQVPGKTYEYLASNRPLLALTPESGATAATLRDYPGVVISEDPDVLSKAIIESVSGAHGSTVTRDVEIYERSNKSREYMRLIEEQL